ncbi:PAS domain S-box protein [Accumulibacter sp.]|uniref:bifunctional diguanylate cyclase/phosphodiesterase n=1 Tax=Accumulibacter sp. TaxID=2053492 RepID=UPI0026382342|nr:PAS domain S-box protein [Accumulibacter sp.]
MNAINSLSGNHRQRRKLLIGLGLLVLVVLQLLAWQVWLNYQEQIAEAEMRTRNYSTIFATRLDATLRRTDAVLEELARHLSARWPVRQPADRLAGEVASELDSRLLNFEEVIALRVFDEKGDLLYSSDAANTPRINVVDRDYFRVLHQDPRADLVFSEVLVSRATGRPSLIVGRALRGGDGSFLGAVTAVLDLERYQALLREVDLGRNGSMVLRRSDDHRLVVGWPHLAKPVNKPLDSPHPIRQRLDAGDRTGTLNYTAPDGIRRIDSFRRLERYPFYFITGASRDDVLSGWRTHALVVGFSGLTLLALLSSLLWQLWRSERDEAKVVADLVDSGRQLRANSERLEIFQRLVEAAGQGIGMARLDGTILYANPALRRMLDMPPEADCGDYSFEQFYSQEDAHRLQREVLPQVVPAGQWTGEIELRALSGRTVPTIHTLFVIHSSPGEAPLIANVLADISERRRMEERNRQLLAEMETLLGNALVGIVHLKHRRVVSCNRRLEELFGYSPGELIGQSSRLFYPSQETFERIGQRAYSVVAENRDFGAELMFKRKDGSVFWGALTGRAIDPGRPQEGSIWVFADISERREAEEESRNLLQAVEQSPVAIVITNRDAEIEYVNPSFTRVTGYSRLEAIGQNPRLLQSGEAPPDTYRNLWQTLLAGKVWTGLFHNRRKNGELFWEKASIAPIFGDHGEVTHYLAVKEDVTERLRADKLLRESEEAFRRLFEDAKDPLLLLKDGSIVDCNKAALELLGYVAKADLLGHDPAAISPPYQPDGQSSREKGAAMIAAAHRFGYHRFEWSHQRTDGSTVPVEVTLTPITLRGEVILHTLCRDVSERRVTETRLRLLAAVFEHSAEGIMVSDRQNRVLEVNHAFCRLTGYTADEVRGRDPRLLSSGRTSVEEYRAMWQAINATGHWQGEIWDRRKDGSVYPKWLSISTIRGGSGNIEYYIGSFVDISERKAAEERISHLAHFDTLTDLPNRSNLQGRLDQALASARRDGSSSPVVVMFLDLDRFKTINDTLGHHVGDALLLEVSSRLRGAVRESDVVARLGGDEFVVVLTGADAVAAERVAGKILKALSLPYQIHGHTLHSTSSIGIAVFPADGESVESLMQNADAAMYHAKSAGRNTVQFFTASMNQAASDRRQLEEDLHLALQQKQFVLHYQPQVDAEQRVFAVEALLRWQHPRHGLVSPGKFVPLAEDTGLIVPIGHWVLTTACAQLKAWAGMAHTRELQIAVNVSARQFRQADFVEVLKQVLATSGAEPRRLKLELTESLVLDNVADTIAKMNAIKLLGVTFAMDDFGTGYSSLSYLTRLPVDQLKIDRAFVSRLPDNQSDAVIAQTIVTMGRSLGLKVVAEGVENEEQRRFLGSQGCHGYQGFLFSRPLTIEAFEAFLASSACQ